jgi:phosphoglycerol geranylgeranyltransferase
MGKKKQVPVILMKWKDWVHVTKLDPDKHLRPGDIDAIAGSGTDALMLSGTLNVTHENLSALLKQVKTYDLPLVMEPAGPDAVLTQGIDYIFVPSVINSADVQWVVGKHRAWVQAQKGKIPWDSIVPEAYIVLNPESSVGKLTRSFAQLKPEEVAAYTIVADHYFHFPIVYIEYSGVYGDPGVVKAASEVLDKAILYYGGGINSAEKAAQMSRYADTIVVGNAVYDQGAAVLKATVDAIQ